MAFVNNAKDGENTLGMNSQKPEEENKEQTQTVGGAAGVPISSGSQTSTAPTGSSTPKTTPTSGKASFQQYQQANQGNAASKLVDTTNSTVANQVQAAKTGINKATQEFNQKSEAGSLGNKDTAVSDVKNIVQSARQTTTPVNEESQYGDIGQDQANRFQQVINAKYEGPTSLNQTTDFQKTLDAANKAGTSVNQSKTAQGREELLRNIFSQSGNYTQGLNKLDSGLLNASQTGVSKLQDIAKNAGNINNQIQQAQLGATTTANNLNREIRDIRNQARDYFNTEQQAEIDATEARLDQVKDNWNTLGDYYRDLFSNQGKVNLTQAEADLLGLQSGQGLYNTGANAIKSGVYDRDAQITRAEQARQAVLSQLAGLDASGLMNSNLRYTNTDKAGTQTALDAINREETKRILAEAEKNFSEAANNRDITARGSKDQQVQYRNTNVADALARMGYNDGLYTGDNINYNNLYRTLAGNEANAYRGNSGKGYDTYGGGVESWDAYNNRVAAQRAHNSAASQINDFINSQGFNNRVVADETGMDDTRRNALSELLKQLGVN